MSLFLYDLSRILCFFMTKYIVIRVLSVSDIPRWMAVVLYIVFIVMDVYFTAIHSTPVDEPIITADPVIISAATAVWVICLSVECSLVYNMIWLGKS